MPENTDRAARRVVVWRVTSACDLDCGFCGFARSAGGRRAHADSDQVLAIGAALGGDAAATGRETLVSWLGGEPLLWPGFVAVSRRFREDFGLRLSMTTNAGRMCAPGLAEFVAEYFDEVTFSLDSDDLGQHEGGIISRPSSFDFVMPKSQLVQATRRPKQQGEARRG